MIEIVKQPWPWYIAGPMISIVMFCLLCFGNRFGLSSNLRSLCSIAGAGKLNAFFKFDWKAETWNLVFVLGALIGGYIARNFLSASESVGISTATIDELEEMGIANPGQEFLPSGIFGWEALTTPKYAMMLIGGGILVGFGTRYANGCTSGHAISGLSDLQLPSLVAVIGFFIGGLTMTHLLLPLILAL